MREKVLKTGEILKMLNCLGENNPPQKGEISPRQSNVLNMFNISPVLSTFFSKTELCKFFKHFPGFKHFFNVFKTREMLNVLEVLCVWGPPWP